MEIFRLLVELSSRCYSSFSEFTSKLNMPISRIDPVLENFLDVYDTTHAFVGDRFYLAVLSFFDVSSIEDITVIDALFCSILGLVVLRFIKWVIGVIA